LKLFKTDEYINGNLKNDSICLKISLIRQVEKMLKLDFIDVTFNSCQLNISLDTNLFEIINSTFETKKETPQTIKELKYLYVMMLKNIADINFITQKQNTSRKDRNYIFSIDEDVIKYHVSIDKIKRNYHKDIVKKYKIIENQTDNNVMKNLILKEQNLNMSIHFEFYLSSFDNLL
jgi:hypothetical protein